MIEKTENLTAIEAGQAYFAFKTVESRTGQQNRIDHFTDTPEWRPVTSYSWEDAGGHPTFCSPPYRIIEEKPERKRLTAAEAITLRYYVVDMPSGSAVHSDASNLASHTVLANTAQALEWPIYGVEA